MKVSSSYFKENLTAPEKVLDKISKQWEKLTPSEQEKVIDHLLFQYTYPITRDVEPFTNKIVKLAEKVLSQDSAKPFQRLSPEQQKEILGGANES